MNDQHQLTHPSDEVTQHFWQAWREQMTKTPRLAPLLLQRGRELLERFQHFYSLLRKAPRPLRRRWQRKLGASLAGVALALALSSAPGVYAIPNPAGNASLNGGPACDLIDAITAANTDTDTGGCGAGNPGLDTITLLGDVTLYDVNNTTSGSNGLPPITSQITIEGAGFTIARAASAPNFRILLVEASGNLTLNNTTITGGNVGDLSSFGGGILSTGGTLTISNSTISGNTGWHGGGISNSTGGTLTIINSTVSGNNGGSNATGGGIRSGYGGTSTIINSTVSGNSAGFGAGLMNLPNTTTTLINSTVSGNSAGPQGGGIFNFGALTLERSLISGNTASAGQEIYNYVYVGDCLSAADANAPTCLASASAVNSADLNLFGHSGETSAQAFSNFTPDVDDIVATSNGNMPTALSSILNTTLADNDGGTETHALVAGSPAIDAATGGPATDQRGVSRPQGSGFDIGAYELEQASNQPPVVAANNADVTVDEGQTATNSGMVSDADGDTVTLGASVGAVVNNGDGTWLWSFDTTDDLAGQTVTITADDGNGGTSSTSFDLTVNNVAPTVGAISVPVDPQQIGTAVNASDPFSDPGTGDTHTATWDWGDGSTSAGTVGSGAVGPDSHTYTTPGVYTVQLTVTDDDGGVGQTIYQFVVVYDPAGGFVTGGGWITSPAGAYPADPSLTGKANFGFNSKYKNGQSTPSGNTEFQFKVANLTFKSSSYEWLVVAGAHAKFKGAGTINGSGNYGFMLTATDGQVNGGGGIDKFRIKIWDKNNGDVVVYDNQMGQGDDSNAGTALGGGSIVIHKGGASGTAADNTAQDNSVFLPLVTR
ncbi:MAG: choice-of-anchor Q domain-containing protein [Caldilineaceae bacterium]